MLIVNKPQYISFAGVDQFTDINKVKKLSSAYPIQWGILCSKTRMGQENRYPALETMVRFTDNTNCNLGLHLCGVYAKEALFGNRPDVMELLPTSNVETIQVNTKLFWGSEHMKYWLKNLKDYSEEMNAKIVMQHDRTDCFPGHIEDFIWMYEASGGNGVEPSTWPINDDKNLVGYAGGINPDNALRIVQTLQTKAHKYYIDMESGIRTDDKLDLDKCYSICKQIYGAPEKGELW